MCDHTNKGKNIIEEKLEIAVVLSMYIYVYTLNHIEVLEKTFQPKEIRVKKGNRVKKTGAN